MKKQIIITVLIFLAITAIGISIYYFNLNQRADNGDDITGKSDGHPQVKKLNCEDMIDVKEKENCLAGVMKLLNSDNNSVCDVLITETDKSVCRNSYIIKEAARSGDLNKCAEIADKAFTADCKAQASFSLAIQRKDKKYCENIINKTDKESCFKVLAGMGVE
ncbi:MAG: hypothetical protein ABIB72_03955 [Candidatus Falkowbacteria bacterium]